MTFSVNICVMLTIMTTMLVNYGTGSPASSAGATHEFGPFITDFAIDIFKYMVNLSLHEQETPKNVIFSPSSAFRALLLLSFSSGEVSKAQLEKGLHISGVSSLVSKYKKWQSSKSKEVMEGDRLYRDRSVKIAEHSIGFLGDEIKEVDMDDKRTVREINEWVSQMTNGQVTQLLEKIDPEVKLILLSAIFMKGEWASSFGEKIEEETFTLHDESTVEVPMMYKKEMLMYFVSDSLSSEVVSLDYKDSLLKFVVFVPYGEQTLENLVSSLSRNEVEAAMDRMEKIEVTLGLPKFKVVKEVDFVPFCKTLGITDVFDKKKADLSAFESHEPLYVKEILHKVVVEVDREGTSAAAVTKARVKMVKAAGIEVIANLPFVYMIYDSSSRTPLFLGAMMNPKE